MSDHDFGSFDDHQDPLPYDDTPGPDDHTPLFDHDDHEPWSQDDDPAHGDDLSGHDSGPPGYGFEPGAHDVDPDSQNISNMSGMGGRDGMAGEHGDTASSQDADDASGQPEHFQYDISEMSGTRQAGASDEWDDHDPGHAAWDDPDAAAADHVDVFPPVLDVGDLPQPVDGFPWIDTGSLGVAGPGTTVEHLDPVRPEELAAYAAEQLPPGQDPWAVLAASDDPATSALARWWQQN